MKTFVGLESGSGSEVRVKVRVNVRVKVMNHVIAGFLRLFKRQS